MPFPLEKKYYSDHAQRYPNMSDDERKLWPDEVYFMGWIKREMTHAELCALPKGNRPDPDVILLHAKDVRMDCATRYH